MARVLEKKTRHSTRRRRGLGSETRHRPSEWSVRTVAGSGSGGLLGLVGFRVGLDTPNLRCKLAKKKKPTIFFFSISLFLFCSYQSFYPLFFSFFFFFFLIILLHIFSSPIFLIVQSFSRIFISSQFSPLHHGTTTPPWYHKLCD